MANQFGGNPDDRISWSNGLTAVLFARIAVAAAELYQTDWEHDFAQWIATRDQNLGGLGMVGFDLTDIPWGRTTLAFVTHRRFVMEAAVHAASREVAYRLPYYPNPEREDLHRECLRQFALMVHRFAPDQSADAWAESWNYWHHPTDTLCVRHRLFCHSEGCMVCTDG